MQRLLLPDPPDPNSPQFKASPVSYNRALYDWARKTKGAIETAASINWAPVGQPFTATAFTTSTHISGTTTGTDIANVLASLIQALTAKGLLAPAQRLTD